MSRPPNRLDLIILTADRNTQFALRGILSRTQALGIRSINEQIFVHPRRDPGVLRESHDFLREFSRDTAYALAVLDREGCGSTDSREALESQIEDRLAHSGWGDRARAIVIDPELEAWVWSHSTHVAHALNWRNPDALRGWLGEQGFRTNSAGKPERPKESLERALFHASIPRSSGLYETLAKKVSFTKCTDSAFAKLTNTLRVWFGAESNRER